MSLTVTVQGKRAELTFAQTSGTVTRDRGIDLFTDTAAILN